MTTTYSFADLATNPKDEVRFYIGDTGVGGVWNFQDEEINYVLTDWPSALFAAAALARRLAASFAGRPSKRVGDLSINYADMVKNYLALAEELEAKASTQGMQPYTGGISHADKEGVASDTDRVAPPFRLKQFDNPNATVPSESPPDMEFVETIP